VNSGRAFEVGLVQLCGGLDDVLAIVENDQHPLVAHKAGQNWNMRLRQRRKPKGAGQGAREKLRIGRRGEIHEPCSVVIPRGHLMSNRQRDACLPDAPAADDRSAGKLVPLFRFRLAKRRPRVPRSGNRGPER